MRISGVSVNKKCNKCGKCCFGVIGPVIFPDDLEFISTFLNISPLAFISEYCKRDSIHLQNQNVEIYYLKIKEGHCVFLNNFNLCQIYNYRPYQCRNAPFGFLAKYELWSHMECIKKEDFYDIDSHEKDKKCLNS